MSACTALYKHFSASRYLVFKLDNFAKTLEK
nr:MAG TPA: hypothetical protein [Caudoviricetes sp.]